MYQQEKSRGNLFKDLEMHEQCLSEFEENSDDISHATKKLAKHIKMILTQCGQMTEYQDSFLNKSNILVSTKNVTRSGKVIKGPVGTPCKEKETQEKSQKEENLVDSQYDTELEARRENQASQENSEANVEEQDVGFRSTKQFFSYQ
jgi:hypothetical protein